MQGNKDWFIDIIGGEPVKDITKDKIVVCDGAQISGAMLSETPGSGKPK